MVVVVDDAIGVASAVVAVHECTHCRVPYFSEHPYSLMEAAVINNMEDRIPCHAIFYVVQKITILRI